MRQEQQPLTVQAVILHYMEQAARRGDMEALKGHSLVYQAIIDRAKSST